MKVIPKDLLELPPGCLKDSTNEVLQAMARNLTFVDDSHIRIMNKEGLDCFIYWREMHVVGFSKFNN